MDIRLGGYAGRWGALYAYCSEAQLGKMFDDPAAIPGVVVGLLVAIGTRLGCPVVVGTLDNAIIQPPQELISDDPRVVPYGKPKPKRKPRANYQNQEWYGDKGDRENWAKPVKQGGIK